MGPDTPGGEGPLPVSARYSQGAVEFSRRAEGQAYSGLLQPWGHAGGCAWSAGREVRARGPRRGGACLYFPKKESV